MNIFAILANTPLWAWALLFVVVLMGLRRTRDRIVTAPRLVLMPLIILGLAVSNLATAAATGIGMTGAVIGLLAGIAAGVAIEGRAGAERVGQGVLLIKGEWVSFVVVLAIFLVRYASIVVSTVDPVLAAGDTYHFVTALLSGFFAALTLARTGLRLRLAYSA
jgi:hypothetical protein